MLLWLLCTWVHRVSTRKSDDKSGLIFKRWIILSFWLLMESSTMEKPKLTLIRAMNICILVHSEKVNHKSLCNIFLSNLKIIFSCPLPNNQIHRHLASILNSGYFSFHSKCTAKLSCKILSTQVLSFTIVLQGLPCKQLKCQPISALGQIFILNHAILPLLSQLFIVNSSWGQQCRKGKATMH